MRIPSARVPGLAAQMVAPLMKDGDLECVSPAEVQRDVESVLEQYIRDERQVTEKARAIIQARGLSMSDFGRIKRQVAQERKLQVDDEAIDYILDQTIEFLMMSHNVEEVYAEDFVLRRKLRGPLRRLEQEESQLGGEVTKQMRHLEGKEDGAVWDVEYKRMMEEIRRRKGL